MQTAPAQHPPAYTETSVDFGNGFSLNGIVCRPDGGDVRGGALVILNSGRMHRVGSCRLSVNLARKAAQQGILSLRFDHSGIGDSHHREVKDSDEARILEEIGAALDYIEQAFGISRFTLYGLCSGAHYSFRYALDDRRVSGLAGIDNWTYPTPGYYLRYYGTRIFRLGSWTGTIARQASKLAGIFGPPRAIDTEPVWVWPPTPPREFVENGFRELVKNGVRLNYTYTGRGGSYLYNYAGQMVDMFPGVDFGEALTVHYLAQASHEIAEPVQQEKVIENLVGWLGQQQA